MCKNLIQIIPFVAVIFFGSAAFGGAIVETWPVSGEDDTVTTACASLAGWYAVGDSYGDNIEIRDVSKNLVRTITAFEMHTLLPWMSFSGGPDGPSGLTWSDSGRLLFILVHDDTIPGDGQGSDAILRYDTFTDQLSVFARLDLWWRGDSFPFLSAVYFRGKLYVGTWNTGIRVYKGESDDITGALLETVSLPMGNFVRGLCVDRESGLLYAATESGLFRADLSASPLAFDVVDTSHNYRAISYSSHYGFGPGLYYLNETNQVYYVPSAQARGQQTFLPALYWTSSVSALDIAASADGHLLVGLGEDAAWISDDNDTRLSYEAWKVDEFGQLVTFCKGLVSPDGEPPGWVIDADVDMILGWERFHPASPDGAMWVILVLITNDYINGDIEAVGLVREILKRYAGLAEDGIVPERSADGFYHHWYEPSTGGVKSGWDAEIAVLSTMKIVLAADRAAQFYPEDAEIQQAATSIINSISGWGNYVQADTDCLFLRGLLGGGPEANSAVCPFFEGILYVEQAAIYGGLSEVDVFDRWLNRSLWPTSSYCNSCGLVTGNVSGESLPAFVSLYPFLLQPNFRNAPDWQYQLQNLLCSSAAWTDDEGPRYYTVFSAGTTHVTCSITGYHPDSLSDHPCDVATFPSLIASVGWSSSHPYRVTGEAAMVGAYNAYRCGARQAFRGVNGINPEILYRLPNDLSWLPNSAGLADVALGALALGELLVPGVIDTALCIPYSCAVEPKCLVPLISDLNGDCRVDLKDCAILASEWLNCNLYPPEACWE